MRLAPENGWHRLLAATVVGILVDGVIIQPTVRSSHSSVVGGALSTSSQEGGSIVAVGLGRNGLGERGQGKLTGDPKGGF